MSERIDLSVAPFAKAEELANEWRSLANQEHEARESIEVAYGLVCTAVRVLCERFGCADLDELESLLEALSEGADLDELEARLEREATQPHLLSREPKEVDDGGRSTNMRVVEPKEVEGIAVLSPGMRLCTEAEYHLAMAEMSAPPEEGRVKPANVVRHVDFEWGVVYYSVSAYWQP